MTQVNKWVPDRFHLQKCIIYRTPTLAKIQAVFNLVVDNSFSIDSSFTYSQPVLNTTCVKRQPFQTPKSAFFSV